MIEYTPFQDEYALNVHKEMVHAKQGEIFEEEGSGVVRNICRRWIWSTPKYLQKIFARQDCTVQMHENKA